METWVEEIEGWDDRPFSGGYDGLRDLAATDFSGAVSAGGTWLFMVNGRVVAVVQYRQTRAGNEVVDADIERFEGASGTAYAAPDPSIPLLVAMKTRDGDSRGRYYSVKTPIDEVAATLEDGGFTGYVELSENVLSGDYYSVYQAGRSMDLAFIGNARRLKTGEDAHERMVDEVGIYEVIAVDLDVVDIPGGDTSGAAAAGAVGATDPDPPATESNGGTDTVPTDPAAASGTTPDSTAESTQSDSTAEPTQPEAAIEAVEPEAESTEAEVDDDPDDGVEDEPVETSAGETVSETNAAETGVDANGDTDETTHHAAPSESPVESSPPVADPTPTADETTASPTDRLATRSVPSLDPSKTSSGEPTSQPAPSAPEPAPEPTTDPQPTTQHADPDELADLREELREAREELASTREERDELAATVEQLRARIRELEASAGGGGPSLTPTEAFANTNLFVRYGSKGALTVEDVHDGEGDVDALLSNLQLTHHTQFEASTATVDGRPFDDWLSDTQRFRFARWLVSALVFEIRDTGSVDGMRDLYDALPELDRVEFDGTVTATDEEGERSVGFDIVCRNRMGEPLVVARLESSREPVSEASMGGFATDVTDVVQSHESLVGACYVTSAFFAPEALETAREATSGSLLSRDRRKSYVKISRSRGYHLALVESREENFHLSVPDL